MVSSIFTGSFRGILTGLPHFRQNCASSGKVAPHLLQPRMTFVADDTVLFVGILTGSTSENCGKYQETSGDVQTTGTAHWMIAKY
jgi:hypothetical protein